MHYLCCKSADMMHNITYPSTKIQLETVEYLKTFHLSICLIASTFFLLIKRYHLRYGEKGFLPIKYMECNQPSHKVITLAHNNNYFVLPGLSVDCQPITPHKGATVHCPRNNSLVKKNQYEQKEKGEFLHITVGSVTKEGGRKDKKKYTRLKKLYSIVYPLSSSVFRALLGQVMQMEAQVGSWL